MATSIFVNLPVADLERSKAFFATLGYRFNPQFTDEKAACMVIDDTIFVMLLVEPFFRTFIDTEISDTSTVTEALVALSTEDRAEVDRLTELAVAAGGREYRGAQDLGFMYSRAFADLDGHRWELVWMDPAHLQP